MDPARDEIKYLLGEPNTNEPIEINNVPKNELGIQQLIANGNIRAACNLTQHCISICGQGFGRSGQPTRHTPHSLQLWFTRFALLIKLGEFDLCKQEADLFHTLERADIYYDVSFKYYSF